MLIWCSETFLGGRENVVQALLSAPEYDFKILQYGCITHRQNYKINYSFPIKKLNNENEKSNHSNAIDKNEGDLVNHNGSLAKHSFSSPFPSKTFFDVNELLDYATARFKENFIIDDIFTLSDLQLLQKRPFFFHIHVDTSLSKKICNYDEICKEDNNISIFNFVKKSDEFLFKYQKLWDHANLKFFITEGSSTGLVDLIKDKLFKLEVFTNVKNKNSPFRPSWDSYFMKLANLAASRSNCMKRRVGCCIVRDCRVIATGYNGTPRNLTNCHDGGCPRCNNGESGGLHTCLCLHAEENALLESGRDRIGENATLYCDTCPCLTCTVKIVQAGIKEVVFSQSYSMDQESFKVFKRAGVLVRQFSHSENDVNRKTIYI
ncbi:related to Deoxycytidylate deaminase [Saccharomycodes ludwigii]|uniref:Deoxycytidylate deaminase n=1 Tax=Saccharomycodes ludwigii TaxID=36035 RepID=A0A376B8S9_9ASCO|nr:hypothetical protein SCDLUD_002957 [Saccharomycodes ludwigii]KAH3901462.1 hypothetical protein SCDLUD_002957 [Saccharomycodes ludwigii]SSD61103.1 related to Deoxycytidylate deaminase [Saccharomycodes ludwigii]